jgi:ATP-dependent RNA helicase RhlE
LKNLFHIKSLTTNNLQSNQLSLRTMNTWDELKLSSTIRNAIDDLGYGEPTPIQKEVFGVAMSGQDVCGIAQTGTGKTVAYVLPCLMHWKFAKVKDPQVLIIVPTRELVTQVIETIHALAKYTSLIAIGVYGGVGLNRHKLELENGADIVVGTPGRMFDLMMARAFKTKNIKRVVIDEVDIMLDLGFRTQLNSILDLVPPKRQNLLFSATMQTDVAKFIEDHFVNVARVEVDVVGKTVDAINQILYHAINFSTKMNIVRHILKDEDASKILIFTGSKKMANRVYESLAIEYMDMVSVIHSNKEQTFRFRAIESFESGEIRVLVATDILSRGIDVTDITHVINFDVPDIEENYIHRIGRTGRAKKIGVAITLAIEKEMEYVEAIEAFINMQIPQHEIPDGVVIDEELLNWEIENPNQKELNAALPKIDSQGAYHEKSEKNTKRNMKVTRKEKMHAKYGKAITRGQKPTKKKK